MQLLVDQSGGLDNADPHAASPVCGHAVSLTSDLRVDLDTRETTISMTLHLL